MPTQSLGFVSLAPRGDWDANTTYKRLDTVNYGGSSYIVLKALTGVIPTGDNVNYMLLASKGDDAFQVWLLQPGNEGKNYEDYEAWLKQPATEAGQRADEAATRAQGAADTANNATATAQNAAQNANTAAEEARTNAATAKSEADAAREATSNANNATTEAQGAAKEAREAAQNANEAAGTIDDKIGRIQEELNKKANKTEIPTSLPANGGNADTVDGFGIDDLGKIINTAIADIDNTPGFFSGFWNTASAGTKPDSFGTVLQVTNKYGLPNSGKEVWVFQIAHTHGIDRPMWRRQTNNGGWSSWKEIALYDEVLLNTGEQTLSNGRLNMLVSAPEHVIMFKDFAENIGYIGFGGYPAKGLQLMNYATGKFIEIAADGKLYYDQKELAFKEDISSPGSSNIVDATDEGTETYVSETGFVYASHGTTVNFQPKVNSGTYVGTIFGVASPGSSGEYTITCDNFGNITMSSPNESWFINGATQKIILRDYVSVNFSAKDGSLILSAASDEWRVENK